MFVPLHSSPFSRCSQSQFPSKKKSSQAHKHRKVKAMVRAEAAFVWCLEKGIENSLQM